MNFATFILNEEIIANGKSLDEEDDKKNKVDYTQDKPEDDDTPKEDPAPVEDPPVDDTEDDGPPDYTQDSPDEEEDDTPKGDDQENPEDSETPDAGLDSNADDGPPDYTQDSPDGEDDTNNDGDGTKDDANGEDNSDASTDAEGTPDYTQDSPDGEDDSNGVTDDSTDTDSSNDGSNDAIKQLEDDVFASLSPEQIAIKQLELKENFIMLYTNIEKVIERLSKINRVEDNIKPIEFVTRRLLELKTLVRDSLIESYDTRSYVENQVLLQRHMAIFSALTDVIDELAKEKA